MLRLYALPIALACALLALAVGNASSAQPVESNPIDASGFRDGASHWRRIRNEQRVIQPLANQPSYDATQVAEIANNILLFQRANGGWPKDYDMTAILTAEQRAAVLATRDRQDTSFDNHNIHTQVAYLAQAYVANGQPEWREACIRGLDFMLAAELPCGAFPQSYPNPKGYSAHITFNDGVSAGILNVLHDIADGQPQWSWLDDQRRSKARAAVGRGIECILKCQILVDGRRTGWCQQHDAATYQPAPARTFEPASICPQDTTEILSLLMRDDSPSAAVVAAIDAAVVWLREAQLSGIRVVRVSAAPEEFIRHQADFDVVVELDETAPPIWARHYEIGANRPIFLGRDAVTRYALAEIERERRTGTQWYGKWPEKLLDRDYPRWRSRLDQQAQRGGSGQG